MKYANISSRVKEIEDNYENDNIVVVDGKNPVDFNQRKTLRYINAYLNDSYVEHS